MKIKFNIVFLVSLFTLILAPSTNAQVDYPACLQIPEAQNNFDIAKAKSDAASKVANSTTSGLSASFYKSAKAIYSQMKKEENTARNVLKSLTQKCGKKLPKRK